MALTPADIAQIRTLIAETLAMSGIKISELPAINSLPFDTRFPVVAAGSTQGLSLSRLLGEAVTTVPVGQDLREMNPATLEDESLFYTTGVLSPRDGGGGFWIFDAASVATDDSGTVIAPNSGVGRFLRVYSEFVDPCWYGAKGDGTTNDTVAIQAAINNTEVSKVLFPPGTFRAQGLVVTSGKSLIGVPGQTIIRATDGTGNILGVNPGTQGTTNPADNTTPFVLYGIELQGRSDLGFSEFVHNLILSAVSDVLIEKCRITAFRGDGIYLGCFVADTERHNERIVIRDTVFDGVNKENRNAITVTDATQLSVYDCFFTRCVKSTMPAAIDIEPNPAEYTRLRDINIERNRFLDVGGTFGAVALIIGTSQPDLTVKARNFTLRDNSFDMVVGMITADQPWDAAATPVGITIENNFVGALTGNALDINGFRHLNVLNNRFVQGGTIYFAGDNDDIVFSGNTGQFIELAFDNASNVTISNNTFNIAGNSTWVMRSGTSKTLTNFDVVGNVVTGGSWTHVFKNGAGTVFDGNNTWEGNSYDHALINEFDSQAVIYQVKTQSKVWDPGNLAAGASTETVINTFTDLFAGPVAVSLNTLPNSKWTMFGHVIDSTTVHVTLVNNNAVDADVPSGTLRATVFLT